jgi:hypothetical protein
LINNRQGGGRRRGRGGQGGRNLGGQPGNRQDNRQRGNAAQLLEKYKSLARDAQLAGDRVQTEYYLQYADHYFRVLSENRARFEEQNPRRQRDDLDEDEGDEDFAEASDSDSQGGEERPERERFSRRERGDRNDRSDRGDRGPRRQNRDQRASDESDEDSDRDSRGNGADDSLPLDVLPPAIGADNVASLPVDEPAPAPRRRSRAARPAKDDGDEVAPAA